MPTAPQDSPNVIFIVLDDLGFADLGSFGGEIATPSIDAIAGQGLRFTNFHTRSICSPTRASLLTGRNSHAVGMKDLAGNDTGYANARGRVTPAAATIAQMLRTRGYSTYALGKWHLTPHSEMVASGDRTHWPLQKGFDRFYGFLSGWTDQFHPALTIDNQPALTPDRDGYHFSEDIVDQSIKLIRTAGWPTAPSRSSSTLPSALHILPFRSRTRICGSTAAATIRAGIGCAPTGSRGRRRSA